MIALESAWCLQLFHGVQERVARGYRRKAEAAEKARLCPLCYDNATRISRSV